MDQHIKPYPCLEDNCQKSFARPSDLARHKRVVHQKEGTFLCDEPGCKHALEAGAFNRKDNLEAHLKRKHPWRIEQPSVQNGNIEAQDSNEERAEAGPSTAKSRGKKRAFAAVEDSDVVGGTGSAVTVPCSGLGSGDETSVELTKRELMESKQRCDELNRQLAEKMEDANKWKEKAEMLEVLLMSIATMASGA